MATRIGDLAQNQRLTASMLATQARLRAAQAAAASGKAATRFDQIAEATPASWSGSRTPAALKATFVDQSERLTGRLQLMDQALGSIVDIADRARAAAGPAARRQPRRRRAARRRDRRHAGGDRARAEHPARRPVPVRRQPDRHRPVACRRRRSRRPIRPSIIGATTVSCRFASIRVLEVGYGITADDPASRS